MNQSATRMALRRGTPHGRVCSASTCVAPASTASCDRDRRGHAAVEVAPPADRDGLAARPRHPRRGEQRRPQLVLRAHPGEGVGARGLDVDRDAVQLRLAVDDPLMPGRVQSGGEVEDLLDVDHGLAPDHLHRAHERARRERARSRRRRRAARRPRGSAAPLIAPADAPTTRSKHGVSSSRSSAAVIPADTTPRIPPPSSTSATRCGSRRVPGCERASRRSRNTAATGCVRSAIARDRSEGLQPCLKTAPNRGQRENPPRPAATPRSTHPAPPPTRRPPPPAWG